MKVLIVYDSVYGNTEKIALSIEKELKSSCNIRSRRAMDIDLSELEKIDLLIIGSPTQWNKPIKSIRYFLDRIPKEKIAGLSIMIFDTRLPSKSIGILGHASEKMARAIEKKGARVLSTNGFLVSAGGMAIESTEINRAVEWIKTIEVS
jgi:flavodoxin